MTPAFLHILSKKLVTVSEKARKISRKWVKAFKKAGIILDSLSVEDIAKKRLEEYQKI